jgi:hypothetical protein
VFGARLFSRIKALAEELSTRGGKAIAVATEITQSDQVSELPLFYNSLLCVPKA